VTPVVIQKHRNGLVRQLSNEVGSGEGSCGGRAGPAGGSNEPARCFVSPGTIFENNDIILLGNAYEVRTSD